METSTLAKMNALTFYVSWDDTNTNRATFAPSGAYQVKGMKGSRGGRPGGDIRETRDAQIVLSNIHSSPPRIAKWSWCAPTTARYRPMLSLSRPPRASRLLSTGPPMPRPRRSQLAPRRTRSSFPRRAAACARTRAGSPRVAASRRSFTRNTTGKRTSARPTANWRSATKKVPSQALGRLKKIFSSVATITNYLRLKARTATTTCPTRSR